MTTEENELYIYQSEDGEIVVDVRLKQETLWLSLNQIAQLFGRDKSVISKHLKRIFEQEELERNSVVAFFATTASDGKSYQVEYFNLDAILSVGYRVNSKQGIRFRKWASNVLNEYLTKGYSINNKKLTQSKAQEIIAAIDIMSSALLNQELVNDMGRGIIEMIQEYAKTWAILLEYDEDRLNELEVENSTPLSDWDYLEASSLVKSFKDELIKKGEASKLFGIERDGMFKSILSNISQTFDSIPLYKTNSERAAYTLYYIIKDHPFVDGNKRIACLLFIYFLKKTQIKTSDINPNTLTTIALLVAESNPSNKDIMIKLINRLLGK
ncbi:MAG: virulence protein RhuM/Fic/DOC family protein [Candidatus Jidaibacter sp.]|jgi:DNA ligase (NAD+)|nr:virulence protein RhuM/Fic/DOC family protein [Candidatus Jidaibacter sp.]